MPTEQEYDFASFCVRSIADAEPMPGFTIGLLALAALPDERRQLDSIRREMEPLKGFMINALFGAVYARVCLDVATELATERGKLWKAQQGLTRPSQKGIVSNAAPFRTTRR